MVKVKVKQNISNKPKFILVIIGFAIVLIFVLSGIDKIKNNFHNSNSKGSSSSNSSQMESILSKQENLLSIEEWKKIADYRAQEFYECTKDLDMGEKYYLYESCAIDYNNNWVSFRNGLEEEANLNYDQQQMLENYWQTTRDEITERVTKLMQENDKLKRPNHYN